MNDKHTNTNDRAIIELHNLTKFYGKIRGIEDVNLTVREGTIFGFMGPNGAGKSTTIRLILGLINPDSGSMQVFGSNDRQTVDHLSRIGYMPGEAIFYPKMKVADLIRYSARLHRKEKECAPVARELCKRFDLDTSRRIKDLSLGNRKKVSIVCALQHRPELLLLDEPTSGLDPLIQQVFWETIKERQSEGATILLSSHVLSEVQHHCEEAAIIKDGRIISAGFVHTLLNEAAKRIVIRGLSPESELTLRRRVQESDVTGADLTVPGALSFLYRGDLPAFVRELVSLQYEDLTIAEPDLEEIFLHYYESEFVE